MRFFALGLAFVLFSSNFCEPAWEKEVSEVLNVEVNSRVYSLTENEDEHQVLEYFCEVRVEAIYDSIITKIQQAEHHGTFIQDAVVSKRVETLSAVEWVNYYEFDPPWPMPNSDSVTHYWLESRDSGNEIEIRGKTIPTDYPSQGLRRMERNEVVYRITKHGDGIVAIYTYGKTTPVTWVPDWLIETWFPDGPAEILRGIAALGQQ